LDPLKHRACLFNRRGLSERFSVDPYRCIRPKNEGITILTSDGSRFDDSETLYHLFNRLPWNRRFITPGNDSLKLDSRLREELFSTRRR
jgi:hypothetical protein